MDVVGNQPEQLYGIAVFENIGPPVVYCFEQLAGKIDYKMDYPQQKTVRPALLRLVGSSEVREYQAAFNCVFDKFFHNRFP